MYEDKEYVVFAANSGVLSSRNVTNKHGALGANQLEWLRTEFPKYSRCDGRWKVLLLHHHTFKYPYPTPVDDLSELAEGGELMSLVGGSQIDIVCHGHRHHPFQKTVMQSGWSSPVTFVCAGSLSVGSFERRHGEIPNLCHIISLESRECGHATGRIETFRYNSAKGWIPAEFSEAVPLDPVQQFGSVASASDCRKRTHSLIEEAAAGLTSGIVMVDLPPHASLHFDLQCMPIIKLNDLVREIATKEFSLKVIGSYPDPLVMLRK